MALMRGTQALGTRSVSYMVRPIIITFIILITIVSIGIAIIVIIIVIIITVVVIIIIITIIILIIRPTAKRAPRGGQGSTVPQWYSHSKIYNNVSCHIRVD